MARTFGPASLPERLHARARGGRFGPHLGVAHGQSLRKWLFCLCAAGPPLPSASVGREPNGVSRIGTILRSCSLWSFASGRSAGPLGNHCARRDDVSEKTPFGHGVDDI